MVQNGAVSGGAAVGQAFQPDSLLVRLESLTYGAKCYPGLNHASKVAGAAAQVDETQGVARADHFAHLSKVVGT